MYLASFQCHSIGVKLYLARRLIENIMFIHVQFTRYTGVLITLRYGTFGSNTTLLLLLDEVKFCSLQMNE